MDDIKTITAAVSEDMADRLDAAVASGDYATTGEVVREALGKWADEDDRRKEALARLRAMIEEAQKGPSVDGPTFMAELRAQYAGSAGRREAV